MGAYTVSNFALFLSSPSLVHCFVFFLYLIIYIFLYSILLMSTLANFLYSL